MTNEQKVKFRCIGIGFCGTVWAFSERGSAYKREDEGPERSLNNDFRMHRRALESFRDFSDILTPQIQIPRCYRFIRPTATEWWNKNLSRFPAGYSPCKMIHCQRIPPFPEATRKFLINKYCPRRIRRAVWLSDTNKDCMVRPCLGIRRAQTQADKPPLFEMFSLRNCPLLADQMEEIGIPSSDIQQYARIMAEALAMLHWIGQMDGNDVKFVLAPPVKRRSPHTMSNILGEHTMWMFDFDLCRKMPTNVPGVKQAVKAFWRDDIFFPRPGESSLWIAFRDQYLYTSEKCMALCDATERRKRLRLSRLFIRLLEIEG